MADKDYSTTDFYTTAVLIFSGFEVTHVTSHGPREEVKRFHFQDSPELQSVIMLYMNGKLEGNIRAFRNAIDTVKDMVHAG
jgi:hypothetical protein